MTKAKYQSSGAPLASSTAHKKPALRLEESDDEGNEWDEAPEARSRNLSDNSEPKMQGATLIWQKLIRPVIGRPS